MEHRRTLTIPLGCERMAAGSERDAARLAGACLLLVCASCSRTGLFPDDAVDTATVPTPGDAATTTQALLIGGYQANEATALSDMWRWDGKWTQLSGGLPMDAPAYACMAQAGSGLLYYGGPLYVNGTLAPDPTSWTWDGTNWTMFAGLQPPARASATMASLSGTPVLFGGYDIGETPLSDTWTWNGSAWGEENATVQPGARYGAAMASLGERVILFGGTAAAGGTTSSAPALADTWAWNGAAWTNLDVGGPSGRIGASMARVGDSIVLYGGSDSIGNIFTDTWVFDGATWTPANVTGPSARQSPAIAGVGGAAILFGGHIVAGSELDDTWSWDGVSWTQLDVAGPPGRYGAAMSAY